MSPRRKASPDAGRRHVGGARCRGIPSASVCGSAVAGHSLGAVTALCTAAFLDRFLRDRKDALARVRTALLDEVSVKLEVVE